MDIRNFKIINNSYNLEILNNILLFLGNTDKESRRDFLFEYLRYTNINVQMDEIFPLRDKIFLAIENEVFSFAHLVASGELSILKVLLNTKNKNKFINIDDKELEGYLIHAITTGLINYYIKSDTLNLSPTGRDLVIALRNNDKDAYLRIYTQSLFKNETNVRLLASLYTQETPQTQFELSYLLFKNNDTDLDSFTQSLLKSSIREHIEANPEEYNNVDEFIMNNELNADTYARTICNWFINVGLVEETVRDVVFPEGLKIEIPAYKITDKGKVFIVDEAYNPNEYLDMMNLHVNNMNPNVLSDEYIYELIFEYIHKEKRLVDVKTISNYLKDQGIVFSKKKIEKFIDFGVSKGLFYLDIKTRFQPKSQSTKKFIKTYSLEAPDLSTQIKKKLIEMGIKEDLKLIDFSFNPDYSKEFEKFTQRLLKGKANLNAKIISQLVGPDSIIDEETIGVIIDNKSSETVFSLTKNYRDQMTSYLTHAKLQDESVSLWWKEFDKDVEEFLFLFVTNSINRNVEKFVIELMTTSGNKGGVLTADNLLIFLDGIKNNKFSNNELINKIKNEEKIIQFE